MVVYEPFDTLFTRKCHVCHTVIRRPSRLEKAPYVACNTTTQARTWRDHPDMFPQGDINIDIQNTKNTFEHRALALLERAKKILDVYVCFGLAKCCTWGYCLLVPYHTIPYHTIPYHTILWVCYRRRTIPYHGHVQDRVASVSERYLATCGILSL